MKDDFAGPGLPEYLSSLEALQQHFRAQLEGLSTTEKGKRFAIFSQKLIGQTEFGTEYCPPELSEKISNDGGVDLVAQARNGKYCLYIQSKLYVDRADDIDSIISKFQAYTTTANPKQMEMFNPEKKLHHFLVITLSPITGILQQYEKKCYSSHEFYEKYKTTGGIHFIDGQKILPLLKVAYNKLSQIPTEILLRFETPYICKENVYIGIMSSTELTSIYRSFGDALFFENVRDFLGVRGEKIGRTTPNNEIIRTIKHNPEKMLSRNNGIVFGADKVQLGDSNTQLLLKNGSVVNGCQTTMCLVDYFEKPSSVLVKVVETDDSWDITKSANYQTAIPDIDLELAKYLRPQLVKRAALNTGVQVSGGERSAFQLIDEIYSSKVTYNETRLLYIGLFSRSPNNVFASNYTELLQDLIGMLYDNGKHDDEIFETLFALQRISQESLEAAKNIFINPVYAALFERLYNEDSLAYRCFISILALCGAVNCNIADRKTEATIEYDRILDFLSKSRALLNSDVEKYAKFHKRAIKIWMNENLDAADEAEIRRDMYIRSKRLNFTTMFRKICLETDLDMATSIS